MKGGISGLSLLIAAGTSILVSLSNAKPVSALDTAANTDASNDGEYGRKLCAAQKAWHPNRSSGDYSTGYCHLVVDCNSASYSSGLECCNGSYHQQTSRYCLNRLALPVESNQILVLEFSNASGIPMDKEAFCDGIQDELTKSLAQGGYSVRDVQCSNFEFTPGGIRHLIRQRRYLVMQKGTLSVVASVKANYKPVRGQDAISGDTFGWELQYSINRDSEQIIQALEDRRVQAVMGSTLVAYEQKHHEHAINDSRIPGNSNHDNQSKATTEDSHIRLEPIPEKSLVSRINNKEEQGEVPTISGYSPPLDVENILSSPESNYHNKSKTATIAITVILVLGCFYCASFYAGTLLKQINKHRHLNLRQDEELRREIRQSRRIENDEGSNSSSEESSLDDLSSQFTTAERNIFGQPVGSRRMFNIEDEPAQSTSSTRRGWSSKFERKLQAKSARFSDKRDESTKKKDTLAQSTTRDAVNNFERRLVRKCSEGDLRSTATSIRKKERRCCVTQSTTDDADNKTFEKRLDRKYTQSKLRMAIDTRIREKCAPKLPHPLLPLMQSINMKEGSRENVLKERLEHAPNPVMK